jgi:hypothetical protein
MNKLETMERLVWYQELRKIFDIVSDDGQAMKSKVLISLNEVFSKLPLETNKDYNGSPSYQGFSFDEIVNHIETMPRLFNWDELLDSLVYLGIYNKRKASPALNLVTATSTRKSDSPKTEEKGTLKEDFPLVKIKNFNEINMGKNLKFLSLGGNSISNAAYDFPATLIALNLSYNIITDFLPLKPLLNLKFLNISNNLIENLVDISGIITLNELFVSNNRLSAANFLFSIKNLCLLDLGNNNIESFEDLAMLSVSTKLHTLNLSGNPLYSKLGYKTSINELFPRLICMDPPDISIYSKYQQIGFSYEMIKTVSVESEALDNKAIRNAGNGSSIKVLSQTASLPVELDSSSPIKKHSARVLSTGNRSMTPKNMKTSSTKHSRSKSNYGNVSLPTTNSVHKKANSIYSNKHTGRTKQFGNPVSAMMIGPSAVTNIFKTPQKKVKSVLIDISKLRPNKNN